VVSCGWHRVARTSDDTYPTVMPPPPTPRPRSPPASKPFGFLEATTLRPPLPSSYSRRNEMKPSISVIAAARRLPAHPRPSQSAALLPQAPASRRRAEKGARPSHCPARSSSPVLSPPPILLSPLVSPFASLCEGMLTRCSAPTFMEMHPLIYPGAPLARACV